MSDRERRRRNAVAVLASLGVVVAMVGLAYASVPLYRLFCQVTGYRRHAARRCRRRKPCPAPPSRSASTPTVNSSLPWSFAPETPR